MYKNEELKSGDFLSLTDGLLDLFIGVYVLFAAVSIWSGLFWMAGILIPVLIPVYQAASNRFRNKQGITSRKSSVNNINTKKPLTISIYLGFVFLLGVVLLGIFSGLIPIDSSWFRNNILLILGTVFGATWIVLGILHRIPRYYLNGLVTLLIFIALKWTNLPFWSALIILGSWISLVGFIAFIKYQE